MEIVIITGVSGSGKTKAADWFEDQGYYCVDNMPPSLIKNFIELAQTSNRTMSKAAFVVDVRGGEFFDDLNQSLTYLEKSAEVDFKILFVEASEEVLIRRYNETRRNHPLTAAAITREVIEQEKAQLKDLRDRANFIIDTTNLKVADMKMEIERFFVKEDDRASFSMNISSFGYKNGLPIETDIVFDVRFLPNPFYVPTLKNLTGNNKKVSRYVLKYDIAKEFVDEFVNLLKKLIPHYIKEGKYHLNVAFGCTGGQHRSVTMANEVAKIFSHEGIRITLEHRDI